MAPVALSCALCFVELNARRMDDENAACTLPRIAVFSM